MCGGFCDSEPIGRDQFAALRIGWFGTGESGSYPQFKNARISPCLSKQKEAICGDAVSPLQQLFTPHSRVGLGRARLHRETRYRRDEFAVAISVVRLS